MPYEQPRDSRLHAMDATVGHTQRLGETLGLVVNAAGPDRVDIAPVGLGLWVYLGVAVDLRCGSEEEDSALVESKTEAFVGSECSHLEGVDGPAQIVGRRSWRGEVHHVVDIACDMDVVSDVIVDQPEPRALHEVVDVPGATGDQVVETGDSSSKVDKPRANVGSQKAGSPKNDRMSSVELCQYRIRFNQRSRLR